MGMDKEGSKTGGGYVGGFFQLFDWTAKSRKKLFSSKSDLPERSKQGKKSEANFPMTRYSLMDDNETGAASSVRGGSDYSCASSVTDDDGYGARAPGVVARLMGLDSLPTSCSSEPNSTPYFDTRSLRDAPQLRKHFDYYQDHQIMYSGNLLSKEYGPTRKFEESKPQKVLNKPIEKFQTEILPPKSAKSVPITHHKLLSPIKSPGFIPSRTAAHIMEAAARIIEPGPQASAKPKMPVLGSCSVPLKVRDIKEKLEITQKMPVVGSSSIPLKVRDVKEKAEAAHRTSRPAEVVRKPVESNAAKYLKGQSLNKSWNGSVDTSVGVYHETEEGSSGTKNKGKSISLAIQAKVNVQRREGLNSSSSQAFVSRKEQREVLSTQPFRSQSNIQKNMQRRSSAHNATGVLRQNNQKQNCQMDRDRLTSKPAVPKHGRKVLSGNPPPGRQKITAKTVGSKVGHRKMGLEVADSEKGSTSSSTRNIPRKKRSIEGDSTENEQVTDRHIGWAEESKRKGMDVVSFTFTAPLTRSMPGSETTGRLMQQGIDPCMEKRGKRMLLDTDSMKLPSVGCNVIGGDALSTLLEQKLRELSNAVESSYRNAVKVGSSFSSGSNFKDLAPNLNVSRTAPRLHDNLDQNVLGVDRLSSSYDSYSFSNGPAAHRLNSVFQGVDDMEECSSRLDDSTKLFDRKRPSPVSILEPSFSAESSSSFGSVDSSSTEVSGSKQCSSVQAQELLGLSLSKKFHYVDAEMELSDSASSTSAGSGTAALMHSSGLSIIDLRRSSKWETNYVKKILCNVELMFQDFSLGRAREIINRHLFNQLESQKDILGIDGGEGKLERKVLFDCVSECLDLRCRRYVGGGYKTWTKGVAMVRRKKWLAEEVHKEISAWRSMGDCMVDELVDKDMSSQYGKWLDFEVDTFVLGEEVEGAIFDSLVDEVVADILHY